MILMGIDIGTTSVKVSTFNDMGKGVHTSRKEYVIEEGLDGRAEIDVDVYWRSCVDAIKENLEYMKSINLKTGEICALSVSSQGSTFVAVDNMGIPLNKAIVWMDSRAKPEAKMIVNEISNKKFFDITGQPDLNERYMPAKIFRLKNQTPDVYAKTYKFLCLEDYILFKLTGIFVTEHTLASISGLFDIRKKVWWDEIFEFIGISTAKMPEITEPGKILGNITKEASEQTGLPLKVIVATGAFDHVAAAVGVGNIEDGLVSENTGGVLALFASINEPATCNEWGLPVQCHIKNNLYYFLPWCQSAGLTIRWYLRTFYGNTDGTDDSLYSRMDEEAAGVQAGSEGLVMLPHLLGAGHPELDQSASGVFGGIRLHHTRAHFSRSVFEALAFMLRRNVENIESAGVSIKEIRSLGGGSKIRTLNRIKCEVLGKIINTYEIKDAGTLGAAIIAGTAVKVFRTLEEGCKSAVKIMESYEPDFICKEKYEKNYKTYISYYKALKGVFNKIDSQSGEEQ